MNSERIRLITEISKLYYIQGLSQQEITEKLGVSRPQVSRMLAEARELGIVEHRIHDPFAEENGLAELLETKYGLTKAIVIDTRWTNGHSGTAKVAAAAAQHLMMQLRDSDVITVGPGTTVFEVSQNMSKAENSHCLVVPMCGGWGNGEISVMANQSAQNIAENLKCEFKMLNAPVFISNRDACEILLQEPAIKEVVDQSASAQIAVVGIGTLREDSSFVRTANMHPDVLEELSDKKACASIGGWFLDRNGQEISVENGGIVGISCEDFLKIPCRIAAAYGLKKAEAVRAALLGKMMNTLVVDVEIAKELI